MYNSSKLYHVKNNIKKLNIETSNNNGFINMTIYDVTTNIPIENAKVELIEMKIYGLYHELGYGDIIVTEYSDSEGQVPIIELASNFESIEQLEANYEHIHYHIKISADNYHLIYVTNILIFPGVTNIYRINLSPITLDRPQYEFIITPIIN